MLVPEFFPFDDKGLGKPFGSCIAPNVACLLDVGSSSEGCESFSQHFFVDGSLGISQSFEYQPFQRPVCLESSKHPSQTQSLFSLFEVEHVPPALDCENRSLPPPLHALSDFNAL